MLAQQLHVAHPLLGAHIEIEASGGRGGKGAQLYHTAHR